MISDADRIEQLEKDLEELRAAAARVIKRHDDGTLAGPKDSNTINELRELVQKASAQY